MISVVIPTLNAQDHLAACLNALIAGVVEGVIREVIIVDGGSSDDTRQIADAAGARIIAATPGRGLQLAAGAKAAKFEWLLFLHADTVLETGWEREVAGFTERAEALKRRNSAAAFRFTLDDVGMAPRLLEQLVAIRSTLLRLPYGDQGLLMPKALYKEIGGFREMPLMEDIDLVRRVPRGSMTILRTRAVTSAIRFKRDGYLKRSGRNLLCLLLYYLRVPAHVIVKLYG